MYAMVTRRKMDPSRAHESRQRAEREFFPKLQQSPGFVSFSLIEGEDGVSTGVLIWKSKADADAFRHEAAGWARVLEDEFGHRLETRGSGEVVQHVTAGA